ncbi:MAG: glycoside hydrolase family 30 protein [Gemmatimonadota bacterium]
MPRHPTSGLFVALLLVAVGCAHRPSSTAMVRAWLTTGDRTHLLSLQPDLPLEVAASTADVVLRVDPHVHYQTMAGFGAAITDASAWLIQHAMTPAQQDSLLTALFSRTGGIGISFTRITMGASDFSLRHYTYDDLPPGQTDPELRHFSIQPNRDALLPVLERARSINPDLRIMATPWSPPAWMKTSGSLIKGRLRDDAYGPLAGYFLKFLQAYQAEGIPIFAISVQNEPHHEPDNYPGMRMEAAERARFIGRHLGPLLERSGFGHVRILDWDHNWDDYRSPLRVLADSAARRYVDGVAWHCYAGEVSAQSVVHAAHPDQDTFFTECSGGEWAPNFGDNLEWNVRTLIVGATRNWSRGTLLWNLALDPEHGPHTGGCADCRGLVTIDPRTGFWSANVEYYAIAHASRFVESGAHRIESASGAAGLESVAFINPDHTRVLIVVNTSDAERAFTVQEGARAFTAALPGGAVVTFTWR